VVIGSVLPPTYPEHFAGPEGIARP